MPIDHDDQTIGRVLTRREVLASLGAAGAAALAGSAVARPASARTAPVMAGRVPSCVVRPAQTDGPYFVDERLNRSDIRSDPSDGAMKDGTPLEVAFRVSRLSGAACEPLAGAFVDLWQCDAQGVYAGVMDQNGYFDSRGKKFLRGYQVTDSAGLARFKTVFPGWYQGRCVHLHFKIRTDLTARRGYQFSSQLYFDDALTDRIHAAPVYAAKGTGRRRNAEDGIYRQGGSQLLLALTPAAEGWTGSFDVGLQFS